MGKIDVRPHTGCSTSIHSAKSPSEPRWLACVSRANKASFYPRGAPDKHLGAPLHALRNELSTESFCWIRMKSRLKQDSTSFTSFQITIRTMCFVSEQFYWHPLSYISTEPFGLNLTFPSFLGVYREGILIIHDLVTRLGYDIIYFEIRFPLYFLGFPFLNFLMHFILQRIFHISSQRCLVWVRKYIGILLIRQRRPDCWNDNSYVIISMKTYAVR